MNNSTRVGPAVRSPLPGDTPTYMQICVYSVFFVISAVGNVTMFIILVLNIRKSRQNRVYLFLLNLNIADLVVTFISMPYKVISSSKWDDFDAPALMCPVMKFTEVFGLYVGANVLVCMSVDRLCAIVKPLYSLNARRKVKFMMIGCWFLAIALSSPQLILLKKVQFPFDLSPSPMYVYVQMSIMPLAIQYAIANSCINGFFCYSKFQLILFKKVQFPFEPYTYVQMCITPSAMLQYAVANSCVNGFFCYIFPAVTITVSYGIILFKVSRGQGSSRVDDAPDGSKFKHKSQLRRSCNNASKMNRARNRTLKVTAVIVSMFLICWTPYYFIVIIHLYDHLFNLRHGHPSTFPAIMSEPLFQQFLFAFAMANTCANPYVYGYFSFDMKRELRNIRRTLCPGCCYMCDRSDHISLRPSTRNSRISLEALPLSEVSRRENRNRYLKASANEPLTNSFDVSTV